MNEHVAIKKPASPDYDADGYGWAMAQSKFIREGLMDEVDWKNVAEEIETMGRNERGALEIHMLKWDVQPERRGRSWYVTISSQRVQALRVLTKNPSLKPALPEMVAEAMEDARRLAAIETNIPEKRFDLIEYAQDEIFNRPFEWTGEGD